MCKCVVESFGCERVRTTAREGLAGELPKPDGGRERRTEQTKRKKNIDSQESEKQLGEARAGKKLNIKKNRKKKKTSRRDRVFAL